MNLRIVHNRIAQSFDEEKYYQRNIVETVFSVMKKKFGESLKTRKYMLQIKEIKNKVILYNISRIISTFLILSLIEIFLQEIVYEFLLTIHGMSNRIIKSIYLRWMNIILPISVGITAHGIQQICGIQPDE